MRINHNIAALNTYNKLSANNAATSKSLEKLSSGLKINKAGDDAAGLAISEKMRSQIRGLDMASKNASDGISLISTAEGALQETHSILQRMRELAVQSANDTNTSADRTEMQKEVSQLISEIDRIANTTQFNNKTLMKGAYGTTATSANSANVGVVSALSDTIASGTYLVDVTSVATQDTWAGTVDLTAGLTFVAGTNDTLTVNGVSINFAAGATAEGAIANRINDFTTQTNITASIDGSHHLVLTDTRTGSNLTTITGNASTPLMGAAPTHTTTGADAVIANVGGVAVTAVADDSDGSKLTINTGVLKGMQIQVKTTTDTNITVTKASLNMQIGANASQNFSVTLEDMGSSSLGVSAVDVSNPTNANAAISTIQTAIDRVSGERAKLGAYQNRLEHTINNLGTSSENLSAAESRIRDVDMAKEMMEFTKNNILSQAAQAMLAQANQQPQSVLQLLQ
jgi:flagellin